MSKDGNTGNLPLGIMFLMLFYHLDVNIWFIRYVWFVIIVSFIRYQINHNKNKKNERILFN